MEGIMYDFTFDAAFEDLCDIETSLCENFNKCVISFPHVWRYSDLVVTLSLEAAQSPQAVFMFPDWQLDNLVVSTLIDKPMSLIVIIFMWQSPP